MKGVFSFSHHLCGAGSTHLTLPVCEQHEDRGGMYVIAHFPSSCLQGEGYNDSIAGGIALAHKQH